MSNLKTYNLDPGRQSLAFRIWLRLFQLGNSRNFLHTDSAWLL